MPSITHVVQRLEHSVVHALDEPTVRSSLAELAQVHNWLTATRAAFVVRLDELTAAPRSANDGDCGELGNTARGEGDDGVSGATGGPTSGACPKATELELADPARTTEREAARQAIMDGAAKDPAHAAEIIHDEAARGAVGNTGLRYVLGFSLAFAVIAMSLVWIIPALARAVH